MKGTQDRRKALRDLVQRGASCDVICGFRFAPCLNCLQ